MLRYPVVKKLAGTYGGRKNCSNTTYMPRINSASKKNFPALSRADSPDSSHFFGAGRRNPAGGTPDGVADRAIDVVKAAAGVQLTGEANADVRVEGRL